MKLKDLIQALIERRGDDQKVVAATWKERWDAAGATRDRLAFDTVETRLSSLVHGRADGIKFFFRSAERREVLLDLLEPTDGERAEILALCEHELRVAGDAPIRLVVDLASLPGDPDVVVGAAADVFLEAPELGALAVVVTEAQYRRVTVAWTERGTRIERVADREAGAARARELAGDAVVASYERYEPYERWIAMQMEQKRLVVDPEDAVERLLRDGRLDPLPAVVVDLASLGVGPEGWVEAPAGVALRAALRGLAVGDVPELPTPGQRVALAGLLGVVAGASDDERIALAFREAGLPTPEAATREELEARLARARRRPLPTAVLRVGEEWHVVNGVVPASWGEHPRVHAHSFTLAPTALARLRAALATWTADDYAADPRFEALLARLDPEGRERTAFAFARAWIVERDALPGRPATPHPEPVAAIRALLAEPAPAAEVLLVASAATRTARTTREITVTEASPGTIEEGAAQAHFLAVAPGRWVGGEVDVLDQCAGRWWRQWWARGGAAWTVSVEQATTRTGYGYDYAFAAFLKEGGRIWELPAHVDIDAGEVEEQERFLDRLEALPSGNAAEAHRERRARASRRDWTVPAARVTDLQPPDWAGLDASLALMWSALAAAFAGATPVRLPGGDVLIRLGGGVAARFVVREHAGRGAAAGAVRAGFHLPFTSARHGSLAAARLFELVPAWSAAGYGAGPLLPAGLTLSGAGAVIDVSFLADPLGVALPSVLAAAPVAAGPPLGAVAALAAAETARAEAAARDDD